MTIHYSDSARPELTAVVALYRTVNWSAADKPQALHAALLGSHFLVTAWDGTLLVGLGNAISDGHLVVYFPHLVVRPEYQHRGIGTQIVQRMRERYCGFHQQVLVADGLAVGFYRRLGFARAGTTEPLWIFDGHEHD
jgi:GNAT superfamily N-acetyltransferase